MSNRFYFILSVMLLAFNACGNKVSPEVTKPSENLYSYPLEMTFYGSTGNYSKTVLNNESVLWESGDKIKVLWGENHHNSSVARPFNNGENAEFTTKVEEAPAYYGVHPYAAVSSLTSEVLDITVPAAQSGKFSDANIAVAKADTENNMFFRHVVSFLEFTIDKPGLLTFSAGASNPIIGIVSVKGFKDGQPVYEVTGGESSVLLDIKTSGTYYISLLPDAKLDILSFTLTDGDTEEYMLSTNSKQMTPGKLLGLGNITGRFRDVRQVGATLESFKVEEFQFEW